jgi:5-methylcytosine-specific restriction endonuclease McrA
MFTTEQIRALIANGETAKFYNDFYWRKLSHEIIREQHGECQICKARGKFTPAVLTHHVKHLKDFPELAYERYQDKSCTVRQLIALCQKCHEEQHPDRFGKQSSEAFINSERW